MEPEPNPEQPHPAVLELAKLRAGLAAGLTPEQSERLRGTSDEELAADAQALATAFGANQAPPAPRSGGNRGPDVGSGGRGSVSAGAALYRDRHGLDEDGRRPEKKPVPTGNGNPFAESGYSMER
ncbi:MULTISPECIES: hypothetical protein [Streptomyces]|uniref:hypothetical protein n=1 Tax=Streptomyces TaxID=1883 RepID=UPI000AD8EA7C|nr:MULTISPECIES: hypothetical protein [Streptomyces]